MATSKNWEQGNKDFLEALNKASRKRMEDSLNAKAARKHRVSNFFENQRLRHFLQLTITLGVMAWLLLVGADYREWGGSNGYWLGMGVAFLVLYLYSGVICGTHHTSNAVNSTNRTAKSFLSPAGKYMYDNFTELYVGAKMVKKLDD